jgi:hypothetical protein
VERFVKSLLVVWVLGAIAGAIDLASAQTTPSGEVHLSVEALGMIVGIIAVVAPAFYFIGRFNQRLAVAEHEVARISTRHADLLTRGIEVGDRMAAALDAIAGKSVTVECHGDPCKFRHANAHDKER